MKVFVKKKSIIRSDSIFNNISKSSSKMLTKKEKNIELRLNELASEIKQKISEGKKPENLTILDKYDIYNLLSYILEKNNLYLNYLLILKQFLRIYNFLEIFNLPECFMEKNELFDKVCLILKKEQIASNKIIYLNGQLGKKFYIILEGVVTILEPIQFCVKATYQQFYQYLQFLLENNEYELIRLSFDSNKKYVNEKRSLYKDKFYKFHDILDRYITTDIKLESSDYKSYLDKFDTVINQIFGEKSFLNEEEKKKYEEIENKIEEEERQEKQKEEEKEKKELEEDNAKRRITGVDAEIDKNEIIDKIKRKKRESILKFYKKGKKVKKKLDRELVFNLWKYDHKIINIKKGDSFGDTALKKIDNKLKHTIISKTNCECCVIERDEYRNLISEFIDNSRRLNVDSIMHSKLFHKYNADLFNIHYFSFFTPIKKSKGEYLFKQKQERKKIFFIKSGGVQIEYLSSWYELDIILDILNDNNLKIKKAFNSMIIPNELLQSYIHKKQKFNMFIYFNGEIVGTNEILYPNTNIFMFDAVCTSDCEIFSLDLSSLENIVYEKLIRKNYNELNILKKDKLIQRLIDIKYNIIFQYNRKIHETSKENNQTEDKKVSKSYSLLLEKIKNKSLVKNNNYFKSSIDINKEIINNNSPGQKRKYSEQKLFKLTKPKPLIIRNLEINNDKKVLNNEIFSNNKFNSDENSKNNINYPKLKLSVIRNNSSEYLKTERTDQNRSSTKNKINFSLKGKVPKLLLTQVNTINKAIDHLILKEKDLFNNETEISEKHTKKFISHLDVLGFDNFMNKIESDLKPFKEESQKSSRKMKIKKLILSPVSLKKRKNKNKKFSITNKKTFFNKDIKFS